MHDRNSKYAVIRENMSEIIFQHDLELLPYNGSFTGMREHQAESNSVALMNSA